jgi:DNA-binding FadR family transcriptional regulator
MFRPVGKPRVAEEIVQQLRSLILRGDYAVGDKLPPERKLAEELGVNRASLREAIKSLEHMGLVKTRQGDGTRVLDFMQTAGVELVSHLIVGDGAPNLQVLLDVLDFRRWFGKETARLAAERATAEDIKKLEQVAERAADPSIDVNELLKLDFEFYVLMTHAAKNRVMQLLINTIRAAVTSYAPFFAQFYPPAASVRKHHKELIKAIAQKDADTASKLTDGYMKKAIEALGTVARTTAS